MRAHGSTTVSLALLVSLGAAGCGLLDTGGGGGNEEQTYDSYPHVVGSCILRTTEDKRYACDTYRRATIDGIEDDRAGHKQICEGGQDSNNTWRSGEECPTSGTYIGTCIEEPDPEDISKEERSYYSEGFDGDPSLLEQQCRDDESSTWEER